MKRVLRIAWFLRIWRVECISHAVYSISGNTSTVTARMKIAPLWNGCHLVDFYIQNQQKKKEHAHRSYIKQNGTKMSLEHICHQVQLKIIWSKLQSAVKISTSLANCDWKKLFSLSNGLSNLGLDCDNVSHILQQRRNPTATYNVGFYAN